MDKLDKNIYKFYRERYFDNMCMSPHHMYGIYLYIDTIDNTLVASWESPTKGPEYLYTGNEIRLTIEALSYYYKK